MMKIKYPVIYAVISILLIFCSCERKIFTFNVDCEECYIEKPDSSDLILKFSKEYLGNKGVPFIIYEGDLENNKIIYRDTTHEDKIYFYNKINKKYTVRAEYITKDKKHYKVINSTKIKTKYVEDECSENCWIILDNEIDLSVKYSEFFQ